MSRVFLSAVAMAAGFVLPASLQAADGPTAPYNEAVKTVDGRRVVEVAPFPEHMKSAVPAFRRPNELTHLAPVRVVETPQGLMDCVSTYWYHPKACSPSTFGKEVRERVWTVKMNGKWAACVSQAKPITCIPLVADGKLRALPPVRE